MVVGRFVNGVEIVVSRNVARLDFKINFIVGTHFPTCSLLANQTLSRML